jgi:hypothetical protein
MPAEIMKWRGNKSIFRSKCHLCLLKSLYSIDKADGSSRCVSMSLGSSEDVTGLWNVNNPDHWCLKLHLVSFYIRQETSFCNYTIFGIICKCGNITSGKGCTTTSLRRHFLFCSGIEGSKYEEVLFDSGNVFIVLYDLDIRSALLGSIIGVLVILCE